MIGAIFGDVVGSRFEFNNIKTKEFELLAKDSRFTDDTVLTVAVADWMMNTDRTSYSAVKCLQKWARKYPFSGFGGMFYRWKDMENPSPYNSFGNGSAMRISPVAWLANSLEEVKLYSDIVTGVTHNHPEGLKGAEVTAKMIYMARIGYSKEELKEYAVSMYPEIEKLDYEELRKNPTRAKQICQVTVPQAIYCFLISNGFEDCLRTAISIGGDSDTIAAISCSIAEAYYWEKPIDLIIDVLDKLPDDINEIAKQFVKHYETVIR